ncbi:MAG: CehA/McbA family metallohydrolase [Phycisphaeraceae bacterium]|nr:CehA/McbA family metallohydrolase [Phycisphaeraceae bacterium]
MQISHPYTDLTGGQWLRGNLHAHSTRSDGERTPQAVIDDYAARGYGFLMLSDHDILSSRDECAEWSRRGMILIPGNEVSALGPHLLHVDADRYVKPSRYRQEVLNQINACGIGSESNGKRGRGFAVINHPNWHGNFDHCSIEQLREWTGYIGVEIFNGVICRLEGSPYATNKWDMLLNEGRRIWGFANDDSHAASGDVELGWNTAYVKERTLDGVIDSLVNGRFYCSTGVTISGIHVNGDRIRIETENAQRIVALKNTAQRFAVADASSIEVTVPPRSKYVRFECWGPGEKFAWTQPFFIDDSPSSRGGKGRGFIPEWRVSNLLENRSMTDARPDAVTAHNLKVKTVAAAPPGDIAEGFVDAREQIAGQPGLVYFAANVSSVTDRRATLTVGYDGPIRIWINGEQVFDGPGTNPAHPDKLALHIPLKRGSNDLVIVLDSNGGRAWGIFGRID